MFYHFVVPSEEQCSGVQNMILPTCTKPAQIPPLHDKKAAWEFAYLALITRSVSSVINEVGEREGGLCRITTYEGKPLSPQIVLSTAVLDVVWPIVAPCVLYNSDIVEVTDEILIAHLSFWFIV